MGDGIVLPRDRGDVEGRATPEIVYYVAASVDGFIATSDGSVEWLDAFAGDDDYGYTEFLRGVEALLMGRRTFDQVMAFPDGWPYGDLPTWVFTHRPVDQLPPSVRQTTAGPQEAIATLREPGVRRAWLVGGGELAGRFAAAGLIDRYIISVMPVLLGKGVRLVESQQVVGSLSLISSTQMGPVVQNVYVSKQAH